ncbi:MAG: GNAT family N-acetyltransferase [Chloroflexota bacterium]
MPIHELEDINFQTWHPSLVGERNGWQFGVSGGYSRRANSVFTHRYHGTDIEADLAYCEHIYNLHGYPARIRTTSETESDALLTALTARGYTPSEDSLVKTCMLNVVDTVAHSDFTVSDTFSDDWLRAYMRYNAVDESLYQSQKSILLTVSNKFDVCFGRIGEQAIGLAVCYESHVAFYNIVVNSVYRRQGYGRAIMQSLMNWAQKQGAQTGILSVGSTNPSAIKLYDGLGFETRYIYRYWSHQNN